MNLEVKSENTQMAGTASSPKEEAVKAVEVPVGEAEPEEKLNPAMENNNPESAAEEKKPDEPTLEIEEKAAEEKKSDEPPTLEIEEKKPENPESAAEEKKSDEPPTLEIVEKKPENPESAAEEKKPNEAPILEIEEKKPENPESAAEEKKPDEPPTLEIEEKKPEEEPEPKSEEKKPDEPSTLEIEEKKAEEDPKSEEPLDSDSANVMEKSSSFKEESNFLSDLKDTDKKALIELKEKLEEAILGNKLLKKEEQAAKTTEAQEGGEEKGNEEIDREVSLWGVPLLASKDDEVTNVVLLKFLRAREFRVKESFEMLQATLQWRKEEKIDSVVDETELDADFGKACYMDGYDRKGHPVCYNMSAVLRDEEVYKKAFGSEEGRRKFLRWRVQVMEKGILKLDLKLPGGVSNLLQVTDLKDSVGPSKKELRDTMKQAVQILQDNYPEFVSKNIFINVPFWYYAFHALISPFLTQRTKSKFVFARPVHVTETLLKYIPAEAIPIRYGGFKRENDTEFSAEDGTISELMLRSGSTETIEIPAPEVGATLIWDLSVIGWEVNYKEEFVPTDKGSSTVIVQNLRKIGPQEETIRNSFRTNEPGKMVLTIENKRFRKKKVLYRYKTKSS